MAINYAELFSRRVTPQSQPIPGSTQVRNSAGGYSWEVGYWIRFDRFLILGAEGGTYYIGERVLVKQNHDAVVRCIKADGIRAVKRISGLPFEATDCALPMIWAREHDVNVSGFITYTDSETWAGNIHPAGALRQYRSEFVGDAKAVVVGMTSNGFTLAHPRVAQGRGAKLKPSRVQVQALPRGPFLECPPVKRAGL